jgi:hypothetical protein
MIVHHNNTIIHIVDGPKPALRYKEILEAIQPGDKFMMKCELFIKENAVPVIKICEVEVKKVYHNWCELKVIEEREEVVHGKKKTVRIERTMSATIGQILTDSTLGVVLSSPALGKVLEKKTLKEILEDKELGRKLLSKGGFKCLI